MRKDNFDFLRDVKNSLLIGTVAVHSQLIKCHVSKC